MKKVEKKTTINKNVEFELITIGYQVGSERSTGHKKQKLINDSNKSRKLNIFHKSMIWKIP